MSRHRRSRFLLVALIGLAFAGRASADFVVLVAEAGPDRVERFSSAGADLGAFASGRAIGTPIGVAIDAAGNVYIDSQDNGTIEKFAATGADLGVFARGLSRPFGLAVNGTGDVLVANQGDGTVRVFSPGGAPLATLSQGISGPAFLAFDAQGNLYISGGGRVEKYSAALVDQGPFATVGLSGPLGLAFDNSGKLYVANNSSNTISTYDRSGSFLGNLGIPGGLLNGPEGLAFGPDGALYASNPFPSSGNEGTIDRFPLDGTGTLFADTGDRSRPVQIAFLTTSVPEPESLLLLGLGCLSVLARGLIGAVRRAVVQPSAQAATPARQ